MYTSNQPLFTPKLDTPLSFFLQKSARNLHLLVAKKVNVVNEPIFHKWVEKSSLSMG